MRLRSTDLGSCCLGNYRLTMQLKCEGLGADQLVRRWPVPVRPVLVFLTGTLIPQITIKQQPDDVTVLDRMDIPSAFKRAPRRLDSNQIEAVFEQARRSATWMAA